jgi:molecular chaperone GrpE
MEPENVPQPKREEEDGIISIDGERDSEGGSSGADRASTDPATGSESGVAAELAKLRAEKEELTQTLVRRQADFENFKKQTERYRSEEARRGVERLITDLIPVLDGFDRALQGHEDPSYEEYRKGIILIRKQLWDALARHGVQKVDAAGKMFDPNFHQAAERVESTDYPDGSVIEVFQDGYVSYGRVLRPAIVRVAVHPGGVESQSN